MAIFDITYVGDMPYLKLEGGTVTGATTFTNNIAASTINGVTVGSNPKFTDTTYSVATTSANGLLPALGGGTTNYLRADGAWAKPPGTTYSVATTSANGLMSSTDKTAVNKIGSGTLNTTNKTIIPAINELKTAGSGNLKVDWFEFTTNTDGAEAIGNWPKTSKPLTSAKGNFTLSVIENSNSVGILALTADSSGSGYSTSVALSWTGQSIYGNFWRISGNKTIIKLSDNFGNCTHSAGSSVTSSDSMCCLFYADAPVRRGYAYGSAYSSQDSLLLLENTNGYMGTFDVYPYNCSTYVRSFLKQALKLFVYYID